MEIILALLTLIALEIVLGIDNIIFILILSEKLPPNQRKKAWRIGLSAAMIMRILLLFSLSFIMKLTYPLFTVLENEISGRDIILIAGGLFLIAKSTFEIHEKFEGEKEFVIKSKNSISFNNTIFQIMLLDIVFSLDSVITAIGMTNYFWIMVTAIIISVIFMMVAVGKISNFVNNNPTIKILALSFLLLIGVVLVADGLNQHIPKGYIYFAMAFSCFVEFINMKLRKKNTLISNLNQNISL